MGYMQTLPSDFYSDKPTIDLNAAEGSGHFSMEAQPGPGTHLQSDQGSSGGFTQPLPFSVDISPEDSATYFSLERLSALMDLKAELGQKKTLTMTAALEADRVFRQSDFSRLYFESMPKTQKYTLAMEDVNIGIAALVGLAAGALVGLLIKLVELLSDKKETVVTKNIVKQRDAAEEVSHVTLGGSALKAANDALVESKDKPAHGNVAQERQYDGGSHPGFVKDLSAVQMDIISTGEYTQAMIELLKETEHTYPVGLLQDARHAYRELVSGTQDGHSDLDPKKAKYYELMAKPRAAHRELKAQIDKVERRHQLLDSGHVDFPKDVNSALRLFSQAATAPAIIAYAKERAELLPVLERMKTEAQEAQKALKGASDMPQLSVDVLKEIHGLLAAVLKIDIIFQKFWKSLSTVARYLEMVVTNAKHKLTREIVARDGSTSSNSDIQQMDRVLSALGRFRSASH